MTIDPQGQLSQHEVFELVQQLSAERWTGRLLLERDGVNVGITVDEGRLVFASSSDPDLRLGPRLLRRGAVTLRQLEDAGSAMGGGKRIGTILVEMGMLQPKELARGVMDQVREIVEHALVWNEGSYRLEPGPPPGEAITLNMSTPQLVLDAVSRVEAWSRIGRGCGGLDTLYEPVPGSEPVFRQLTLDIDQASLLRSVKGRRTVESLCGDSVLNHFEVCRNLWAFRLVGLVRRVEHAVPLDEDGLEFVLPPDGMP
jgi:hypothetical protein